MFFIFSCNILYEVFEAMEKRDRNGIPIGGFA
jgi:hypothetical protein